ncbi:MAG: TetR family transcriptional regulator [Alphaproteobacteria bacterium]|nr:TetR family transcriptional regulator [Alphaproteobacteria bacterium]
MARRTKNEAEQTRNAILDAAEQVFFKHGVVRTSLQEVAGAAGVTRGAVYWHFRNKIELVRAMAERVVLPQEHMLEQLEASDSSTPLDDLSRACRESLRQMIHDPQRRRVFTILTQRCEYIDEMADIMKTRREVRGRILARFVRLFERAQRLESLASGWTPRTAAMTLQGLMFGLMLGIVMDGHEPGAAVEKTNAACIAAFFRALSAGR